MKTPRLCVTLRLRYVNMCPVDVRWAESLATTLHYRQNNGGATLPTTCISAVGTPVAGACPHPYMIDFNPSVSVRVLERIGAQTPAKLMQAVRLQV